MSYLTLPLAVKKLFGVDLAKNKSLKDLIYPLARLPKLHRSIAPNFLNVRYETMSCDSDKESILLPRTSLIKFNNAVILQCIFANSRKVKEIFVDLKKRQIAAEIIQMIMIDRQTALGISLSLVKTNQFVEFMFSDNSLDATELPNPFEQLPIDLGTSMVQALMVQSAAFSSGENMMMYYLDNELLSAYKEAISIESDSEVVKKYQQIIISDYQKSEEFENFLDVI